VKRDIVIRDRTMEGREKRKEEIEQKKAEAMRKFLEDATEWITAHGSERLKLIVDEGFLQDSLAVYRDERLEQERPGWIWDSSWYDGNVEYLGPRNPTLDALRALKSAKEAYGNEVELRYAKCSVYEGEANELVIMSAFLGKLAVLRLG